MIRNILIGIGMAFIGCCYLLIYNMGVNNQPEIQPSPDGRDEYRSMIRGGEIDQVQIQKARGFIKEKLLTKQKNTNKDAGIGDWEELGPGNFAGRVRAMASHPDDGDILFVGGASGGVWKTENGGTSWNPLSDFLPSLSITSIVINPNQPDTMYVSTGEAITAGRGAPGAGIFRSTDGGLTWHLLPSIIDDPASIASASISNFYWVSKVILDPDDPSVLFAATYIENKNVNQGLELSGRVVRFENHGNSISAISTSLPGKILDLEAKSANDTLFIGTSNSNGYITTKSNLSFPAQINFPNSPSDTLNRVEFGHAPNHPNIVYALCEGDFNKYGILYRSSDGGATWSDMNLSIDVFKTGPGGNQGWYDNAIWVDPGDPDNIIIGGIDLWRSVNGGAFFLKISDWTDYQGGSSPHADHHIIIESSDYDDPTNRKLYFGNDGGVASAPDWQAVGESSGWNLINGNSLGTTQFYASDVNGNTLIGGAQDNGTLISGDDGLTWGLLFGGDGGYCAIGSGGNTYLSTQRGNFIRITGTDTLRIASLRDTISLLEQSKFVISCGAPEPPLYVQDRPSFIAPLKIYPNDDTKVLIAGERLWYSSDAGCSWDQVSPRDSIMGITITAIDIDATGNNVYIGYSNGDLYRESSGDLASPNWIQVGDQTDFGLRVITDIAMDPNNSDHVVISTGGYYDDNVWHSSNQGSSWTERSNGIPELHINTLVWHPTESGWIYAGTDLGILATEDDGHNWNVSPNFYSTSDGPAFTEVTHLKFGKADTYNRSKLYATTYGRGIWATGRAIQSKIYVDKQCATCGLGIQAVPFATFEEAVAVAAHGQTIVINGGADYDISSVQVLDKRVVIEVTNGPIVID